LIIIESGGSNVGKRKKKRNSGEHTHAKKEWRVEIEGEGDWW